MKSNDNHPASAADLRKQAEEKAAQSTLNPVLLSPEQVQHTLHELLVHQIELEMQNEELRQSQTDLCASQAQYFDLYDIAPLGYFTLSEKGVVLVANLTAANLLGVARGALVKHPLNGFILREDQDNYYRHRIQLFASYEPDTWELRMVKKDGTAFWAGLDATVVQEKNGEFVGRIVLKDITGRKQAEAYKEMGREVLQILNEPGDFPTAIQCVLAALQTRTGFEAVGIRLQNGDDFPYFVQNGFSEDFLSTENTLTERTADGGVCLDKAGNASLECTCGQVIAGKTDASNPYVTQGGSCWTSDKAGTPFTDTRLHPRDRCIHDGFQSVALVPIRDKIGIVGIIQLNDRRKGLLTLEMVEILEGIASHIGSALMRKHAEASFAAEKERLAVTLRSIGDGVITTDTLGNVVMMNKVAEELTGWKQEEAQGKTLSSVFNIINQSTREPHENPVVKVLSSGQIIELANHTLLISRDGTERIIADSGAPIKDKESKTIGVVLVFRDMTEKHKMLDNMLRIDKLDSLGVLAGGIAHDFNNLLAGIFGYLDMARERSVTDKTVSKYLDKAATVFERAKDLTHQLLTFSKGGAPKRKTGQIGKLVKENAAFVLSGTNVSCDYQIAQDLWLADYDENQIGQVIDNIVINAQQAMPVGGTIVIAVNNISLKDNENLMLKAGNYIKVSITDTGVGIPQELLKRIFDPFFTTKQKGNGLGLATCYSIVQKHDGCIDVESVPGKGSTFHIYLPAKHKGTVLDVSHIAAQHKGKGSILVMDDEEFIREIVGDILTTMGYNLLEAENGEEALQLCAKAKKQGNPICAALFDLTIPGGMGGKETIVKFREQFPEIPVFASSGFSEDPSMARPTEFGFADSIRKPFRIGELAEMLNKHLKIHM